MNSTKELNEDRRAAISSRANVGQVSANWVLNAPQNWTVTTLQKILQVSSGDFLGPNELLDEGYPVFGENGLRGYYSVANSPPNTMLIGRYGALCGNVHIPVNKCWATEHAFRVRPLTKFNQRFVARYIEALELRHLATRAAQPGLNSRMVREQAVALPDLPIQKAIADFLDRETARIDQLIEKKQRMVEVLGEKRQAVISRAVTTGLDPSVRMKESCVEWIGALPESSGVRRGKFLSREGNARSKTGGEELLSVSHVTGVTRRSEKNVYMFLAESNEDYKLVTTGDVVVNTMWAWMGAIGVSPIDGLISPSYGVYGPTGNHYLPQYLELGMSRSMLKS